MRRLVVVGVILLALASVSAGGAGGEAADGEAGLIIVEGPLEEDEVDELLAQHEAREVVVVDRSPDELVPSDLPVGESWVVVSEDATTVYSRYDTVNGPARTAARTVEFSGTLAEFEATLVPSDATTVVGRRSITGTELVATPLTTCTVSETVYKPWKGTIGGSWYARGQGKMYWSGGCGYESFSTTLLGLRWWGWSAQDQVYCSGNGPLTCIVYPRDMCTSYNSDKYKDALNGLHYLSSEIVELVCTTW
jgi:hypothetical protein